LYLRLRYMRQTTDVLLRQKSFLMDTLDKSKNELEAKMNQLEASMLNQNKNKSYLVSVEKAIKQSRNVAEISKSALHNILQIVKFFKVEKIHELVFQTEEPCETPKLKSDSSSRLRSATREKDHDEETHEGDDETKYQLVKINTMLNDLKACLDLPVNFKPRVTDKGLPSQVNKPAHQKQTRNEEYYLEHASVELVSALLKLVVELLIQTNVISSVEQIPFSISRLLYLASNRSDQNVERELFDQFCYESNRIVVDEIKHFRDKVAMFEQLQRLIPNLT